MRIKICCIASPEEAQIATDAGAELLGLVGPMPSGPGILNYEAAAKIARAAPSKAKPILLTSTQTAEGIIADAERVGVSHVQVVRHIDPREAQKLAASNLTYFQVIHVEDNSALDLIDVYGPHCEAFLLDSGKPSQNTLGGTGSTHDWNISARFVARAQIPTFLAGGLKPGNVTEAIRQVRPDGVDICSGVRRNGKLDQTLLNAFVQAIRSVSQNALP